MRDEKKYYSAEIASHLDKSEHVILTCYNGIDTVETADLRASLAEHGAEFHVIKNRILNVVVKERNLPDISEHLTGQTAIVVGGEDVAAVLKVLKKFSKTKDKNEMKVGILGDKLMSKDDLIKLSDLPSIEVLQAQLLGLLNQPASQVVGVLAAVPRSILNVLNAKAEK